ncbi:MAG: acyltransferase [Flavobacteriales bacterium]|nr:acyltransferase [Flavobacteriales bacterium]
MIVSFLKLNPDYENRVLGLDLMRALAITFVVISHGDLIIGPYSDFPWIPLINGVELFFVLSGFLIGGILIKTFENKTDFTLKTIWNFWIRRWLRTLPNYYLILLVNIILVYYKIIIEDFTQFNWKFFLFLHNFNSHFVGFFWESWSLSIEEWFYILFPISLFLLYLFLKIFNVQKKIIFFIAILLFLPFSFLLRYFIASSFQLDAFWLGSKINSVVIYHFDGIALGLLAAFIKFWFPQHWNKYKNLSFILGLILSYFILINEWLPNDFSTKVYKLFLQSLGCFLLLAKFDSIKKAPIFITKIVTHISLISYSMYLVNLALVAKVIFDNFRIDSSLTAWLYYIIYWSIVILLSTLLFKYFERPVLNLREKWSKS